MSAIFRSHLDKFIHLSDQEYQEILTFFEAHSVSKKEYLLQEGQVCKKHYFVLKGCLRKFFINEKGVEQTTEFAIENWWLTDHIAYERQLQSGFHIQAVEKADLLSISHSSQENLLQQHPKMERYFRYVYQRAFAASQMRIRYLYGLSREELYRHFNEHYPEFVQRVPQYLLASFLGFTPEYLSEIRSRNRS
ncbi:Crp/Fnr family transcriptional regulator [Pontibacter sp. 13R65]|uniref:Crp/Fnr family transcriptional regulator n=1 Tax=Pontibacter sp. 13R65 TaxID=3127458 RepID=UPI00301CF5E5